MTDGILLASMLVACAAILSGGVVHALRSGMEAVSVLALTGFASLSVLMACGAVMAAVGA